MKPILCFWLLASLILPIGASAQPAGRQQLRGHIPRGVERLHSIANLPASRQLDLAIGLPLRNQETLTNLLAEIYDHSSTNFHRYLTAGQFTEQFGPAEQDYEAVMAFAKSNHLAVTALHPNRMIVDVKGSVADIERALHIHLRVYKHPIESRNFFAPDAEPSLDLSSSVLFISGLDDFVLPRPMNLDTNSFYHPANVTANAAGSGPRGNFIGYDFRAAYAPGVTLDGSGQSIGLFELDACYPGDITEYERIAGLPNVAVTNVLLDGFNGGPGANNIEVALDADMAIAMAPGLSRVILYEGFTPDNILNRMATDNASRQLSSSWTFTPGNDPLREQIFQQFAAQGQSFFESSGDSGAWIGTISAPADEPYATVVGGTSLTVATQGGAWQSETTWPSSGGGISTSYPIPIWQQGTSMALNGGSTTKRNIPDVACLADAVIWVVANNGQNGFTGGTSAATPLWAGFAALVNQQAAINGQPSVGFLNPAIYAIGGGSGYASAFHDITTGNNFSSGSGSNFSATAGYDLCTGWGSPNGSNTIAALLAPMDAFQMVPTVNFVASGPVGGPFNPVVHTYNLTASGSPVSWYLTGLPPWLTASETNGTLTPGGGATLLHLTVNGAAISLAAGSYTATLWFTNLNNGFAQSHNFTLAVLVPPLITSQPTGLNLPAGATASFPVGTAADAQLFYQWQQNQTNLADGGNIFGSATSMLIISNISSADAGNYSVVVSNSLGSMTSSNAFLTIFSSRPIIAIAPSPQTVLPETTTNFSVVVEGDQPLSYQWQLNQTNLTDGGAFSGSTSNVLTISGISPTDAGNYSVIVSNALGLTNSAPAALTVVPVTAPNVALNTLHSFNGNDGANPNELLQLTNGVFYGTTQFGGAYSAGTIFAMTPGSAPMSLYSFSGSNDGANSFAALAQGTDGNLYGTTFQGGAGDNGTVFNITTNGTLNTLVIFNSTNGDLPFDKMVRGADGNFYGTTYQGGALGHGSIFKLANGTLTTLYSFSGGNDGGFPYGALTLGADGNFYGTTFASGIQNLGTIFKISTNGTFTSLLSFNNTNGANPYAGLAQGVDEFFYGVTANGGSQNAGVLFKISASGAMTNLYSFTGGNDGAQPSGALIQAADGNFYGTTAFGGAYGNGTLFRLTPDFVLSNFVAFDGYNGANPEAALLQGMDGNLYGATPNGGASGHGTIFQFNIAGAPPQIVAQPTNETIFAGSTTTFSVAVFGSPLLQFQWRANGTILSDGPNISGSSTANLTLSNVPISNPSVYSVTIRNALGSVTSTNVVLTVLVSPPQITMQPTNLTLSPNATASFSVGAIGDQPLSYHWLENGGPLSDGGAISGSATANLTISNVTEANNGIYSVTVSNSIGVTNSSNAVLSVIPVSVAGTRFTGLHFFAGGADGSSPSRLTLASDGNLYGTTRFGGAKHAGTVFRVSMDGTVTNLAAFGANTGFGPGGGVVEAFGGNFYGTTEFGGTNAAGNIFMMTPDGTLTNIYSFTGGVDGLTPIAPLVRGADGNLYGSTMSGGDFASGNIFRLTTDGNVTNLYSFTNGVDGGFPTNALTVGKDGNFYGVTQTGGTRSVGNMFKLTTNGVYSNIYSFTDGTDGEMPNDPLAPGPNGSFYGTTRHSTLASRQFYGVIFNVTTNGALSTTYILNAADGHYPAAGLILANDGNYYGTCEFGGATTSNDGTVFRISPSGTHTTLVNFDGIDEGAHSETPLTQGVDGNLYGTTSTGGPGGNGTIFRLSATAAPQITTQPAAMTAVAGSTVSLTVAVFGSPTLQYQWQENATNLIDGGNISGSSSRVLTFANITTNNAGTYSVIVSNALGSTNSAGALVEVIVPPCFISVARSNGTLEFTWSAIAGRKYQVQSSTNLNFNNWTNLGAAITASNSTVTASNIIGANLQQFFRLILQ